ncbi:MAG: diguanylate cyclase [Planctomycetota bacterium]|nr:diguanylate cyclase [Planctomycetota bacterium]
MAKILVIEDDRSVVEVLEKALATWGHGVVVARNGEAGYEAIATRRSDFDLILCDLHLGEMTGKALLDRVGAMIRGHTPVIVISGESHMLEALGETRQWAFSVLAKPFDIDHLRQTVEHALEQRGLLALLAARERQIDEMQDRIEFLVRQNLELNAEARRDALTNLPTRLQLADDLRSLQSRGTPFDTSGVLALLDMDDFRRFNTQGGYELGDRAIQQVSTALKRSSRDCDRIYRWGGDEFVVLIPCERYELGVQVMERLCAEVGGARIMGDLHNVTLSAGVARIQAGSRQPLVELIEEANDYLHVAKQQGGNCVVANQPADR